MLLLGALKVGFFGFHDASESQGIWRSETHLEVLKSMSWKNSDLWGLWHPKKITGSPSKLIKDLSLKSSVSIYIVDVYNVDSLSCNTCSVYFMTFLSTKWAQSETFQTEINPSTTYQRLHHFPWGHLTLALARCDRNILVVAEATTWKGQRIKPGSKQHFPCWNSRDQLVFLGGFINVQGTLGSPYLRNSSRSLVWTGGLPNQKEYDFSFIVHWKAYLCQPVTKVEKAVSTCTGDMLLVFCPKKGTLNGGCSVEVCRVLFFLSMRWVVSYHQGNPGVQDTYSRC